MTQNIREFHQALDFETFFACVTHHLRLNYVHLHIFDTDIYPYSFLKEPHHEKTSLVTALALTAMITVPTQAASTNNNFNVTVNLTSACLVNTAATALNFGAYTAFGSAGTPTPTTSITFKCARGLTISGVAFDTGSGNGVVAGLNYGMTVGAVSNAAGTAATASVLGTADVLTYVVTGSMVAGQAGAGAGGAASDARVLTITY